MRVEKRPCNFYERALEIPWVQACLSGKLLTREDISEINASQFNVLRSDFFIELVCKGFIEASKIKELTNDQCVFLGFERARQWLFSELITDSELLSLPVGSSTVFSDEKACVLIEKKIITIASFLELTQKVKAAIQEPSIFQLLVAKTISLDYLSQLSPVRIITLARSCVARLVQADVLTADQLNQLDLTQCLALESEDVCDLLELKAIKLQELSQYSSACSKLLKCKIIKTWLMSGFLNLADLLKLTPKQMDILLAGNSASIRQKINRGNKQQLEKLLKFAEWRQSSLFYRVFSSFKKQLGVGSKANGVANFSINSK